VAIATYNNRAEVVATLASRGANLDLVSRHGLTALMIAARKGHVAIVGVLLEGGADFNLVNREGRTALMMASREHNEGVVDLLSSYASAFDERRSLDQSISATPAATPNVTASSAVAPASDISCTIS
jgi:ankyrin repeat protein